MAMLLLYNYVFSIGTFVKQDAQMQNDHYGHSRSCRNAVN